MADSDSFSDSFIDSVLQHAAAYKFLQSRAEPAPDDAADSSAVLRRAHDLASEVATMVVVLAARHGFTLDDSERSSAGRDADAVGRKIQAAMDDAVALKNAGDDIPQETVDRLSACSWVMVMRDIARDLHDLVCQPGTVADACAEQRQSEVISRTIKPLSDSDPRAN